jgi:hypothetical protein
MISKISKIVLALTLVGSSVFAQSLADAKKAIDAEQFQKAKSMLKNLTVPRLLRMRTSFTWAGCTFFRNILILQKQSFKKVLL